MLIDVECRGINGYIETTLNYVRVTASWHNSRLHHPQHTHKLSTKALLKLTNLLPGSGYQMYLSYTYV
jgi:hypothetical protein